MTKLKAALAYETKKTACNLGLFVAGVAAFVGAVDLIAFASGYPGMAFSGLYAWSFLFLGFATIVAFNRDWPFFLQNGLTRAQSFGVFAAMCVFSSVALALLDGVLSSAFPAAWKAQSLVMFQIDGYSAGAFFYVLMLNLAVSFSVLAGVVLRKRAGALLKALAWVGRADCRADRDGRGLAVCARRASGAGGCALRPRGRRRGRCRMGDHAADRSALTRGNRSASGR